MAFRVPVFALSAILLALLLGATSESLGPPPGSAGTIDFRYPDIIVNPIPECPSEGVFPHPNDCTWYYRCYASFVPGFYHRAYFHCEPGTVFSDILDQCIGGSGVNGCAGAGSALPVIPPVVPWPSPLPPATQAPPVVNPATSAPTAAFTPAPPPEVPFPWPSPAPVPPCTTCHNVVDDCVTATFCPVSPNIPVTMELCKSASKVCSPCNLSELLCSTGLLFNPADTGCYPSPDNANLACAAPPATTAEPLPTPPPPPPPTPATPCDDCYVSTSRCHWYTVCPEGDSAPINMTLCPQAVNLCLPCKSEVDLCNEGEFFSMEDLKCYPGPETSAMACPQEPPPPPPPAGGSVLISSSTANPIECSVTNLIPNNDWILKEFCTAKPLCDGTSFVGMSNLCTNYYQCMLKPAGGGWDAVKMECPPGMLYSYDKGQCLAQPKPEEYC